MNGKSSASLTRGPVVVWQGELAQAKPLYLRAAALRDELLGESHPDTIAIKHNIAELASAEGDHAEATNIQRDILRRLGKDKGGP